MPVSAFAVPRECLCLLRSGGIGCTRALLFVSRGLHPSLSSEPPLTINAFCAFQLAILPRMVQLCAHLFWTSPGKDAEGKGEGEQGSDDKRALECLQRSLKIADACMQSR